MTDTKTTIMENLNLKNPFNAEFKAPPMPNMDLSGKVKSMQRITKMIITKSTELPLNVSTHTVAVLNPMGSRDREYNVDSYIKEINKATGIPILQRLQKNMLQIHDNNQKLIAQAEYTDRKAIPPVYTQIVAQAENQHKIYLDAVQAIPYINNSIHNIRDDIEILCARLEKLENLLTVRIEEVANTELEAWKDNLKKDTEKYRAQKMQSLKSLETEYHISMIKKDQMQLEVQKLQLQNELERQRIEAKERERLDRIREKELMLQLQQQRFAYSQEFNKQKELFSSGNLTTVAPPSQAKALEEVVLEQDPKQLESFLDVVDSPRSSVPFEEHHEDDEVDSKPRPELVPEVDPETEAQQQQQKKPSRKQKRRQAKITTSSSVQPARETASTDAPTQSTTSNDNNKEPEEKVEDIDDSWLS